MNTLSWLIYIGDVFGRLSPLFGIAAFLTVGSIALTTIFFAMAASDGDMPEGSWKGPLRYLWLAAVFAIMAAILPSRQTMYMIAASEAGEQVVTSPDAVEMMADLKAIIKKRLKDELAE